MNQDAIKKAANDLEGQLKAHAGDGAVTQLQAGLALLLTAAKAGQIQQPVPWQSIPGDYLFNEGGLRKYPDLERCYAAFKIEISGGRDTKVRSILDKINRMKADALKRQGP